MTELATHITHVDLANYYALWVMWVRFAPLGKPTYHATSRSSVTKSSSRRYENRTRQMELAGVITSPNSAFDSTTPITSNAFGSLYENFQEAGVQTTDTSQTNRNITLIHSGPDFVI